MSEARQDIFEAIVARSVSGRPWEVELWWSSPQQNDRLVQVYVDQRLTAVTADPATRRVWLLVDPFRRRTIELLAVAPIDAGAARPWLLKSRRLGQRHAVEATVMRDEALPHEARLKWAIHHGPTHNEAMWPGEMPRGGFGGLFGVGGFGFDAATGPGLGRGELGWGPLGSDGWAMRVGDADVEAGPHELAITVVGRDGSPLIPSRRVNRLVSRPPAAASEPRLENGTLNWQ